MGMIGSYLRVTPDELKNAIADEGWLFARLDESGGGRSLDVDKAWHAIGFLLERVDFPVNVVFDGEAFGADNGYGQPRYLTPERVRTASEALAKTSFDELLIGVEPSDLTRAEVYPGIWDEPDSLDYVRAHYEPLVDFFASATLDGDAVLLWLD
jgi:hypothetical protein